MDTSLDLHLAGPDAEPFVRRVEQAWSRCLAAPRSQPADVSLRVWCGPSGPGGTGDATADLAGDDHDLLLHQLSPLVTTTAIGHQGGRLLMLHAAALAGPDGRAVGLVAPSGTGKTTACATLGAGLGYVTDETLAVHDDLTIASYPKPLSVVVPGTWQKEQHSPDDLALVVTPAEPRLVALVLLRRDGSGDPWLEDVPTVRALAALSPESSFLSRMERPLHRLAETVHRVGGLRVLHYAEAADLVPVVAGLLEEDR